MRTDDPPPPTPLDHLAHSLRARASVPSGQATPAAILWTGDRDARAHQYTVQMQPRDNDKSGTGLGLPVLGWRGP